MFSEKTELTDSIKITRGDDDEYYFQRIIEETGEIIKNKVDNLFFTVKKNTYTKEMLFQKKLDDGITFNENDYFYCIKIDSKDTDNLSYQDYVYDIEEIDNGKKRTIGIGYFTVKDEITHVCNEGDNDV